VAPAGNGFTDNILGLTIVFSRVDVIHAEIQSSAHGCNRRIPVAYLEVPSSLTNYPNLTVGGAKSTVFHVIRSSCVEVTHRSLVPERFYWI
jgi:hypothetical protein